MSFGTTHREDITLDGLTKEEFLAASITVAESLGWIVQSLKDDSLEITTPVRHNGSYELLTLKLDGTNVEITSEHDGVGFGSKAQNEANINAFINALNPAIEKLNNEGTALKLREYADISSGYENRESIATEIPELGSDPATAPWWSFFIPTKDFFITPILLNLNIAVFLLMALSGINIFEPDISSLLQWGANSRASTLDGEVWRLFTSVFVHIGVLHLVMNMIGLVYIGALLEPLIGKARFLTAYLLTGIAASVISLWWHANTVSAGASGAIFGMFGVYLALITTNLFDTETRKALLKFIGIYIGVNLVYGLKDGVDAAAHIGGLVSGIAVGYMYYSGLVKDAKQSLKAASLTAAVLVVLAASMYFYKITPNDIIVFDRTMKHFSELEAEALHLYRLPETSTNEDYLRFIRTTGIANWQKNVTLLQTIESLDLPPELLERNKKLQEYAGLRLRTFELLEKSYAEDSRAYDSILETKYAQTATLLKTINGEE